MPRDDREFERLWQATGLAQTEVLAEQTLTIAQPGSSVPTLERMLDEGQLPRFSMSGADPDGESHDFQILRILGEGGMGVVRLARERVLHREVALKTLQPARRRRRDIVDLLREAWVTGWIEHPNIVPIYSLGRDATGCPVLVMKRISGTAWSELLADPEHEHRPTGVTDTLAWSLRILIQVCNAVHFAHSRGVLHRDIKPANVMIGGFGEVYLVDWGLAVGLSSELSGRLPLASSIEGIAGTPAYMAPEMIDVECGPLSERTDVYLLGSTLHELLTGHPPHIDANLRAAVYAAFRSQPREYPGRVPRELAAIAQRAMQLEPEQRYQSAEELRLELEAYLEHRSALELTETALQRLEVLRRRLHHGSSAERPDADSTLETRDQEIGALFAECRFGLQQALRAWPDNEQAHEATQSLLEQMIAYELQQEDVKAARRLLAELPAHNEELAREVEALGQRLLAREERLQHMQKDVEVGFGARERSRFIFFFGGAWTLVTIIMGIGPLLGVWAMSHLSAVISSSLFSVVATAWLFLGRQSLFQSGVTRKLLFSLVVAGLSVTAIRAAAWHLGLSPQQGIALTCVLLLAASGFVGIALDSDILWMSIPFAMSVVACLLWPAASYLSYGIGLGSAFLFIVIRWRQRAWPAEM